jgi:hypothetical protein
MGTAPRFPNWNIDVPDYQLLFMAAFPFTTQHVEQQAYESSENCLKQRVNTNPEAQSSMIS